MKRILFIAFPLLLFLAACSKQDVGPRQPIDESYWLQQERGIVAYSDFQCDYFLVETYNGFTLMRSWGGLTPLRGSVVYGNLSGIGVRTFYNRSEGLLIQADVRDYWLSYWTAMDDLEWYCGNGGF